jgi:FkbM family methyltransferase
MVWAFEPQWNVAQILVANCAINQVPAKVSAVAVGNETKKVSIPNFGDYHLPYNYGRVEVGEPATSLWSVDQVRLDDFDFSSPIRFIKLDVEGMEIEALKGAKQLIENDWPILFVENDRKAKAKELMDYVRSIGYSPYWHIVPLFNPDNSFHDDENIFDVQASFNMICVPPDGPNQITFKCEMLPVNDETLTHFMPGLS